MRCAVRLGWWVAVVGCLFLGQNRSVLGADIVVSTRDDLVSALGTAQPGDSVLLNPGTYQGGLFQSGLTGVTLRSADLGNPAVIQGGTNNIQLSDAKDVTIEHLIFAGGTGNGINIDDGGSFTSPSTNVTIRDVVVRDVGSGGNEDGIKLSGVTGFLIDRVQVIDWGGGGSAIDPVGSHHGLIQNSLFVHNSDTSSGIRPKGGSKSIVIRANRIELRGGSGRAIQAGGSTGSQFFRFIDGDSGYEASNITAEGNVVIGGSSAFSYVNIDGGIVHRNYVQRPQEWTMRILNENQGNALVDTQNGEFFHNKVVFNDTDDEYKRAVNIGPETLADTFVFADNTWFNQADPTPGGSTPSLPSTEIGGSYGVDPLIDPDAPIVWTFDWGAWIVNANASQHTVDLQDLPALVATPGDNATFMPLEPLPLGGNWSFSQPGFPAIDVQPYSQLVLIDATVCPTCALSGDYDGDSVVASGDYDTWKTAYGQLAASPADGNLNGRVDAEDYTVWRDNLGATFMPPPTVPAISVPEPPAGVTLLLAALLLARSIRQP